MKVASPIYDLKSLIDNIEFGSIDISGLFELYLSNNKLEEYEVDWLLSLLFVCKKITFTNNEMINVFKNEFTKSGNLFVWSDL